MNYYNLIILFTLKLSLFTLAHTVSERNVNTLLGVSTETFGEQCESSMIIYFLKVGHHVLHEIAQKRSLKRKKMMALYVVAASCVVWELEIIEEVFIHLSFVLEVPSCPHSRMNHRTLRWVGAPTELYPVYTAWVLWFFNPAGIWWKEKPSTFIIHILTNTGINF